MTIKDLLRGPAWMCQWRCPSRGKVNRTRQQDLPPGVESLEDLLPHLICHSCQMTLKEIPLMQIVVHETRPAAIPQKKNFPSIFGQRKPKWS
jgi:hypothetical protein